MHTDYMYISNPSSLIYLSPVDNDGDNHCSAFCSE
jgi:alpha-ketoglutarate-dependent taurine dioxygenase